ncbi:MAG: hypothetical protein KDD43_14565 [Bdellovibrionales bacterium]|nr:hypothetical protein [Bdellovibrionales bacterium]
MNQLKDLFSLFVLIVMMTFFTTGCATQNKSTGLGGAIGAGTGAILGGIADPGKDGKYRTRNVIVGTALGGIAGMATGSILHKKMDSEKKAAFLKGRTSAPHGKGAVPSLKEAKIESRWVEGRVVGNRYVDGHYEYVIVEPARWDNE